MYGYAVKYTPLITNANTAFPLLTKNNLTVPCKMGSYNWMIEPRASDF